MHILWTVLSFLAAIMVLVFIHEYGHFKVARLCGIRVKRFSLGFGVPFYKRVDRHGTEWAIAPFPLGGYVAMVDSRVEPLAPGEELVAFDKKSLWKRSAVVLAGPLANLVFAWAVWSVLLVGPAQDFAPYLGSSVSGSIADKAGFDPNDEIVSIDGAPIASLTAAQMALMAAALSGQDAQVKVRRDGSERALSLPLSGLDPAKISGGNGLSALGFSNSVGARAGASIKMILPGSPGALGGLLPGDTVVAIDGRPIPTWSAMGAIVNASADKPLAITARGSDGATRELIVTPKIPEGASDKLGKLGATLDLSGLSPEQKKRVYVQVDRGVFEAMGESAQRCVSLTKLTFSAIGSMFSGRSGSENLSGPVGIAKQAGSAADNGFGSYASFLAFLSLSLFIMNLLPLPALDGGHLVLFSIEAIMGRPLSDKVQAQFTQVGFSLLMLLMVFALYNDLSKLFA